MEMFGTVLGALAPLFVLMALGYLLRRWSLLHHEHVPILNNLVLNALLPASIVKALYSAPSLPPRLFTLPMLMLVMEVLLVGVCVLLARRFKLFPGRIGAVMLTGIFGNTAFLGYPIVQTLLPRQFPAAVMIDEFGMMVFLYVSAAVLGAKLNAGKPHQESAAQALKRFAKSPLFLSIVAGVVLRFVPIPSSVATSSVGLAVGHAISQCVGLLSQATTPVVLIALGLALEPRSGDGPISALVFACGMKLVLCPLVVFALCLACGVTGEERTVLVLQAGMPAGVLTSVLAHQHGIGGKFAVRSVCVSTALAAITIPVLMMLVK